MTEDNQNKHEPEPNKPCCTTDSKSDCCSTPQQTTAACCSPSARSPLKTIIFSTIILAAIVVAVISLSKKPAQEQNTQPAGIQQPLLLANGLETITELSKLAPGKDIIYVLLPGQSFQSVTEANSQIESAVGMLTERGQNAAAYTLKPETEGYDVVIASFEITQFPAVITIPRGCKPAKLDAEITRDNLISAYIKSSANTCSCGPGGCSVTETNKPEVQ